MICDNVQRQKIARTAIFYARKFFAARRAVTAVEYAIIVGVMAAALVASVPAIAPSITSTFNRVSSEL